MLNDLSDAKMAELRQLKKPVYQGFHEQLYKIIGRADTFSSGKKREIW